MQETWENTNVLQDRLTRKFLFVIPPLMEEILILPFQKLILEIN